MDEQPKRARFRPAKIISGGQTGVDRAALNVAIELGIPHGGHCPRGRLAEDGRIPPCYHLVEMPTPAYAARTEQNVRDADATLIISPQPLSGGTALTARIAGGCGKPQLTVDPSESSAPDAVAEWLDMWKPTVLNVADPRESQQPGIADATKLLLAEIFAA